MTVCPLPAPAAPPPLPPPPLQPRAQFARCRALTQRLSGVNFDAWDNVTLQTVKESMEPKAAKKGKGGGSGGGKKRKASAAAHDDEGGAAAED